MNANDYGVLDPVHRAMAVTLTSLPISHVRELIECGDREAMRKASFKNFHTKHLRYINLVRTPSLTIKLYLMDGEDPGFAVNPHSHAYNFDTYLLTGYMENRVFSTRPLAELLPEERRGSDRYREFKYRTPLNNNPGLEGGRMVHLWETYRQCLRPRQNYYLNCTQIHTIVVPEPSILLLYQYADKPLPHTYLYTRGEVPDTTGLYVPYEKDEFNADIERVLESI